jgi:hypothetical protein
MAPTKQKLKSPRRKGNHFKNRKGKSVKPPTHGLMLNAENFEKAMIQGFDDAEVKNRSRKSNPMKGRTFKPIPHPHSTTAKGVAKDVIR